MYVYHKLINEVIHIKLESSANHPISQARLEYSISTQTGSSFSKTKNRTGAVCKQRTTNLVLLLKHLLAQSFNTFIKL